MKLSGRPRRGWPPGARWLVILALAVVFRLLASWKGPLWQARALDWGDPGVRLMQWMCGPLDGEAIGGGACAAGRLDNQSQRQTIAALREEIALLERRWQSQPELGLPLVENRPLVAGAAIPVRRLGSRARGALPAELLLDVGQNQGASAGLCVLAPPAETPLIDAGGDRGLAAGAWVLADRRVWGRLSAVGRHTSTVQPVTDRRFREVVEIVSRQGATTGTWRALLEGTGQPLARLRGVPATEAVAEGDLVLSARDREGSSPLWFGRVARAQRAAEATEWELWMQPAVTESWPERLWVWRWQVSSERLAARPGVPGAGSESSAAQPR